MPATAEIRRAAERSVTATSGLTLAALDAALRHVQGLLTAGVA